MKENKKVGVNLIVILAILVFVVIGMLILISKNSIIDFSKFVNQNNKQLQAGDTVNGANGQVAVVAEDEATKTWDLNRVNIVYDTDGVPVPVPKGYVASGVEGEHTVNDGFVIYEGEDEVTGVSTDSSVLEAQKTRNQWVWVPIYDPSEIYGVDENGMMLGKLYDYSNIGRTAHNWSESNGIMEIVSNYEGKEPDIVLGWDKDRKLVNYLSEETRKALDIELREQFKMTIESIKKYGGFYIGRYETGGLSGKIQVTKMNDDLGNQTWYKIYEKIKELKGINCNIETNMIWGNLWDATLEWFVDTNCKTYEEVGTYSTSWGNYSNATFEYTTTSGGISTKSTGSSTVIPTGSTEYTNANNIYDMAGNVLDWTLEAYFTNYRRCRGGYCGCDGTYTSADYRGSNDPGYSYGHDGFRAYFYIK